MPIYKQTTEITNIDDLLSSVERDIEEVYFGDKQVFTVWGEYDGTLPAQYSADGSTLADYRVYGSAGGVGDKTGNLWDESYPGFETSVVVHYEPVYVGSGEFTLSSDVPFGPTFADLFFLSGNVSTGASTGTNGVYIGQSQTVQAVDGYVTIAYRQYDRTHPDVRDYHTMLTPGSTAPAEYVPYGYGLSLSVTSPKSYTCEVDSLQASTNYAKIAVAELPTAKVGDKIAVTVGGTDYSLPVKNVDNSYVYIENMEV